MNNPMHVLVYNDLIPGPLRAQFERTVERLRAADFAGAEVKKLSPTPFYRARLSDSDRLLFRIGDYNGERCLLLLEIIRNHAYDKSRFLNGAAVDEAKLINLPSPSQAPQADVLPLTYVNPKTPHFHVLDKIISFDEAQGEAFRLHPPFILIGSAGSGKTVLTLEKMKQLSGDGLYVTLSAHLTENARNLYYAHGYDNTDQEIDFLSFREFVETIRVPEGRPMTYSDFVRWFGRHHGHAARLGDPHRLYEEFNGVLTGSRIDAPWLSLDDYLALGVRQSIYPREDRPEVYEVFHKYLDSLKEGGFYDANLAAHRSVPWCKPAYDWVVVDEVQDLTNVQLFLILKALRRWDSFILCGDSNQIVHPNFFSWSAVKSLFYERNVTGQAPAEILRILHANYRNSQAVTALANRILLIKTARFGSIDRESNYLVQSRSPHQGGVELLAESDKTKRELNDKTCRSVRHAVLVPRDSDKAAARQWFKTPLLFSIQEAKGLEYENVVLLNFVSGGSDEFREITDGVTPDDLNRELKYARARDKSDKSMEAYRFHINALYVALTRSIRHAYLIETNPRHRMLELLGLRTRQDELKLAEQQSTREEWKEEARKLELQGKAEQADAIRKAMLGTQPVPWTPLTPGSLEALKADALNPERFNIQAKHLLFEYALAYDLVWVFTRLAELKYSRAREPWTHRQEVKQKYERDYTGKNPTELRRKLDLHGVDFRNPLNQTPLMVASLMGREDLVAMLIKEGANPALRDNSGRTAFQLALREGFWNTVYASTSLGAIYRLLAPTSIKVKIENRMIKLDERQMTFFLLNAMLAMQQDILRVKIHARIPAFETADFVKPLAAFPHHVIPEYRRKRAYLSSVLAGNEVMRPEPHNRKLFVRILHGFYVLNPLMEIEIDEHWVNVYDWLRLDDVQKETANPYLANYINLIADLRKKMTALPVENGQPAVPASFVPQSNAPPEPFDYPPDAAAIFAEMTGAKNKPPPPPAKIGRNDPCPCGSGLKYKRCCGLGE